jgi:phospholipid/cholesterol/gamma-HCH transport system substrate-binding protein
MRKTVLALVSFLMIVTSGCSLQLLGAPRGHLTLTATFDNVSGLLQGNTVETSNVIIGSVTRVALDGYRARVTMSISDGHRVPVGSTAAIRRTSFLGEHFVDLVFPPGFSPATGRYLAKGASISDTHTDPEVDQIAGRAGQLIGALAANDIGTIVQTGAQALGGRGPELHRLIGQLSQFSDLLGTRSGELAAAIDSLGQIGSSLAPLSDRFGALLDSAASTTQVLTADRDRFFTSLGAFDQLASSAATTILGHADKLGELVTQANSFLGPLAQHQATLASLADHMAAFFPKIPQAISQGQLLVAAWANANLLPPYLQKLLQP